MACVASHMATTRPRLLKKSGTHQTVAICNVDNFVQTFKLQNKTKYMTSILTLLVVMTKRKIVSYFSILLKKRPCCPTVLKGNQNVVFFLSCFLVMLSGILFSVAHWAKTAYSYSIMGPPATSWQLHNYIIMSCHILLLFYCLVGNKRLLTDWPA